MKQFFPNRLILQQKLPVYTYSIPVPKQLHLLYLQPVLHVLFVQLKQLFQQYAAFHHQLDFLHQLSLPIDVYIQGYLHELQQQMAFYLKFQEELVKGLLQNNFRCLLQQPIVGFQNQKMHPDNLKLLQNFFVLLRNFL